MFCKSVTPGAPRLKVAAFLPSYTGRLCLPVGIGLTDLPKTGGGAIALPPYSGISINSKKIDEILLDNAGAKKTGMFHQKGFQLYVLS